MLIYFKSRPSGSMQQQQFGNKFYSTSFDLNVTKFASQLDKKNFIWMRNSIWLRKCGARFYEEKFPRKSSGCGSVGRAVTSDTRGPRFESSHWQKFIHILNICLLSTVYWKDENKEKEAGNGPFLKKRVKSPYQINTYLIVMHTRFWYKLDKYEWVLYQYYIFCLFVR